MKKLATLVFSFLLIGITANATTTTSEVCEDYTIINSYDGKTYIFVEGGVEFSVFADGQFDFAYVGPTHGTQVQVSSPNVNVSFNSGHNYEMYIQYDDYGAVIQVENVPIYYDNYGRITQAGDVDIRYNNRRIVRVGGLYVNYDRYGYYSGYTGYINVYNRYYVYRPWHVFYVRPLFASCIVWDYPYRRYYNPYRYSYHHHSNYYNNRHTVAYINGRRDFHRPGSRIHRRDGRVERNRDYRPNRKNTMVSEHGRRDKSTSRGDVARKDNRESSVERGRTTTTRGIVKKDNRESAVKRGRTTRGIAEADRPRSNNRTTINKRSTQKRSTVNNRSVQKRSTVNKRSTPKRSTASTSNRSRTVNRSSTSRPSNNRVAKRSTSSRSNTQGSRSTTTRKGRGL